MKQDYNPPALQFQQSEPRSIIEFGTDALRFIVNEVEVFRLTPQGMEYKGQTVEDAGVAYREVTAFFSSAKEAVNQQVT
jgi:hypothetical protein